MTRYEDDEYPVKALKREIGELKGTVKELSSNLGACYRKIRNLQDERDSKINEAQELRSRVEILEKRLRGKKKGIAP